MSNTDERLNRVPPIIANWINDLAEPRTPQHVKDNICLMLESLVQVCDKSIRQHRSASLSVFRNPKK